MVDVHFQYVLFSFFFDPFLVYETLRLAQLLKALASFTFFPYGFQEAGIQVDALPVGKE